MENLYGDARHAGEIARAIASGLADAKRGVKIRPYGYGSTPLDYDGLRQWFRDKIDGMINLKAGLRSDGAPSRARRHCRCRECLIVRSRDARGEMVPAESRWAEEIRQYGYDGAHQWWGGRRWSDDYHWGAVRDRDRLRNRTRTRRFETDLVRARFAHRETQDREC